MLKKKIKKKVNFFPRINSCSFSNTLKFLSPNFVNIYNLINLSLLNSTIIIVENINLVYTNRAWNQ